MLSDEMRAAAEFGCRYVPAYSSRCGALVADEHYRCARHSSALCCVCKAPAMHECNHAGQFVCGAPLCPDCEGYTDTSKSGGTWGFMNHSHRVKPSAIAARMAEGSREMVAADIVYKPENPDGNQ